VNPNWLGLALFLSTQQALVVECSDDDGDGPDCEYCDFNNHFYLVLIELCSFRLDTTEMFHAQYHVIQVGSFILKLPFSIRHHC
jgi:hypothetical protein